MKCCEIFWMAVADAHDSHQASDFRPPLPRKNRLNTHEPVSLLRRFGAMFYDTMLVGGSIMIIGGILATLIARLMGLETLPPDSTPAHLLAVLYVLIIYGFFVYFWTHGGQTLGMRAWKVRVVTVAGQSLTGRQATVRFAWSMLSWLALGAGFFWSLLHPAKLAWHDSLSHTRLVRV